MIDRLLYAATAAALAILVAFDGTFATNLARAFGGRIPPLPFGPWETGGIGVFLGAVLIAIWRERLR